MTPKKILIIAGEPSGDLHASNLVRDLQALDPDLSFFGIGGALSRQAGVDIVFDITKLALVGVVEVLKHLNVVKQAHDAVVARIDAERPDLAILVDYPGFNLKIAQGLARRDIPVVYYISPQVWAWGRQRVGLIKKYVKKIIVFFKFEEELYKTYNIDAAFVGHPLLDVVRVTSSRRDVLREHNIPDGDTVIALLPGSREFEIKTFLPILVKAADEIAKRRPRTHFFISKHPDKPAAMYESALKGASFDYRLAEGRIHDIVGASDFAIVTSGTATLETAIVGTPLVIVYKVSLLTYILYKIVSDIKFLGIVNIVAGREIAPELLQYDMTPKKIADRAVAILSDPKTLSAMREALQGVKASLGAPGASSRAAQAIIPLIS